MPSAQRCGGRSPEASKTPRSIARWVRDWSLEKAKSGPLVRSAEQSSEASRSQSARWNRQVQFGGGVGELLLGALAGLLEGGVHRAHDQILGHRAIIGIGRIDQS